MRAKMRKISVLSIKRVITKLVTYKNSKVNIQVKTKENTKADHTLSTYIFLSILMLFLYKKNINKHELLVKKVFLEKRQGECQIKKRIIISQNIKQSNAVPNGYQNEDENMLNDHTNTY